jgi:glycosyltransferase involved in cell wall biosynthesis
MNPSNHSVQSPPLRIIIPTQGLGQGQVGSEDYTLSIARGLAVRGHAVTVFGPGRQRTSSMQDGIESLAYEAAAEPAPILWRVHSALAARHVADQVRQVGVPRWDVMVSGLLPPLAGATRHWPDVATVYIPQSMISPKELMTYDGTLLQRVLASRTYRRLQRDAWGFSDVVVSYTDTAADARNQYFGVKPRNLVVSVSGVDQGRFVPQPRDGGLLESLGIPAAAPVVLSLCRLITFKDVAFLLRAFAKPEMDPNAYLLIVGDGPRRQSLESQARELGIAARVRFAGAKMDPERFFPLGDVYVLPSFLENCPLSLLQALSCGVPSVARRHRPPHVISACGELIQDGVTGHIVDTEAEMAAAVAGVLRDPQRRRAMAEAARHSAVERFAVDRHVRDIERAVYLARDVRMHPHTASSAAAVNSR